VQIIKKIEADLNLSSGKTDLSSTLLKAAWLSVLLGLGMEVLLLIIAAYFKTSVSSQVIVADLVQKISWSTLVCSGVALGLAASKMRAQAMGLFGFIAAPIAFYAAKALHKSVTQALAIAGPAIVAAPSPLLLALIKAFEYAALGYLIGRLGKKASAGLAEHALTGLGIGLVFGGTIVYLMVNMAAVPLPLFGIISRCANEIIFPVGCAVVLYTAQKLGEKGVSENETVTET
jgi:hypothetical protein